MTPTTTQSKPSQTASSAPAPSEAAPKTAKLFKNGRSQAVRLPKEFRFEGTEVLIRRDPTTGEVFLSSKAESQDNSWEQRFQVWDALGSPGEDVLEREQAPPVDRDFF
jgi:antitoxin VapB